jgi:phage gp29-like protein
MAAARGFTDRARSTARAVGDRMRAAARGLWSGTVPPVGERPWEEPALPQLPPNTLTDVTIDQAKTTLTSFENGQFTDAALLAEHVGRDADIQQALMQRVLALQGRPFSLREADESKASEMVHREMTRLWSRICPRSALSDMLRWAVLLGFAVAQIVWTWDEDEQLFLPILQPWHPAFVWYVPASDQWFAATADGVVEIVPGDGRWVLYRPHSATRSFMYGAIRALPEWFLSAQFSRRDANRFSEIHGQGVWVPKLPAGWQGTEEGKAFVAAIRNIGRMPVIPTPVGTDPGSTYSLDLLEAQSDAWKVFDFLLRLASSKIRLVILGQDMTSAEGASGSFAKSKVGQDVLRSLTMADAETLADDLQQQLGRPFARYLRAQPGLAPRPAWDCRAPEELQACAQAQLTAGKALQQWQLVIPATSSELVDPLSYARQFGLPLTARTEPAPAPGAAAQAGTDEDAEDDEEGSDDA